MTLKEALIEKYEQSAQHIWDEAQTCYVYLEKAWSDSQAVFRYIKPFRIGIVGERPDNFPICCCLTMIRLGFEYDGSIGAWDGRRISAFKGYGAPDKALTQLIATDKRVPTTGSDIRLFHLPLFVAWQVAIDLYFAGELPVEYVKPGPLDIKVPTLDVAREMELNGHSDKAKDIGHKFVHSPGHRAEVSTLHADYFGSYRGRILYEWRVASEA